MDREIPTGHFYISLDISLYLKGPKKGASLHVPQKRGPYDTDAQSRALINISFGVPSKGALPPGPPHGVPSERDAPFLEPSLQVPLMESPRREMPHS